MIMPNIASDPTVPNFKFAKVSTHTVCEQLLIQHTDDEINGFMCQQYVQFKLDTGYGRSIQNLSSFYVLIMSIRYPKKRGSARTGQFLCCRRILYCMDDVFIINVTKLINIYIYFCKLYQKIFNTIMYNTRVHVLTCLHINFPKVILCKVL